MLPRQCRSLGERTCCRLSRCVNWHLGRATQRRASIVQSGVAACWQTLGASCTSPSTMWWWWTSRGRQAAAQRRTVGRSATVGYCCYCWRPSLVNCYYVDRWIMYTRVIESLMALISNGEQRNRAQSVSQALLQWHDVQIAVNWCHTSVVLSSCLRPSQLSLNQTTSYWRHCLYVFCPKWCMSCAIVVGMLAV